MSVTKLPKSDKILLLMCSIALIVKNTAAILYIKIHS